MPLYAYRAVSAAGEVSNGELDAANEAEIVDRLRDQGMMPVRIAPATGAGAAPAAGGKAARSGWFTPRRVTRDHVLALTRELATLLRAGLPLDRALQILIELAPTPAVAALMQAVRDDVRGGKALSQALDARRECRVAGRAPPPIRRHELAPRRGCGPGPRASRPGGASR